MPTKTTKPPTVHAWNPVRFVFILTLLTQPALADFSGSDRLAAKSPKWAELFRGSDRGALRFDNSQLEFWNHKVEDEEKRAYLKWTPNKGVYDQDWFVQVQVHRGRGDVGIGVVDAAFRNKGYEVTFFRGNRNDSDDLSEPAIDGIRTRTFKGKDARESISSATDGILRIHFDSQARTLTSSWKTRRDWHYFEPIPIGHWEVDDTSRLTAVLIGSRGYDDDDNNGYTPYKFTQNNPAASFASPKISHFRNYQCGPASPIMDVEQPAYSDLINGTSKRSFGTAAVGGRGATRTFTIRNNGTAKLLDLKIKKDGTHAADFRITNSTKSVLEPGGSTTFGITFKPKAAGTRSAAIHITSNDADDSPFDIPLTGLGVK
jgi:hypothetical protein